MATQQTWFRYGITDIWITFRYS